MEITIEMIDELRKRTNVNYSDAKKALEESNGDMVEAIIYLEKNNKTKGDEKEASSFSKNFKKLFKKLNNTKVNVVKDDILEIRLPLFIFLIVSIMLLPLTIFAVIIYMFSGFKFKLQNDEDELKTVNETLGEPHHPN